MSLGFFNLQKFVMASYFLSLLFSLLIAPAFVLAQVDDPLVPKWVEKDVKSARWIAKLLPLEKQSFDTIKTALDVEKPTDDADYGFGARRFCIAHGNGYSSFYVDAFTFKGKIGYYKAGIESYSKHWPQIKELIIKAWKESGGPEFVEDERGIYISNTYQAVFDEYKEAVGMHLGGMSHVQVPDNLKSDYEYLISPMRKSAIADDACDGGRRAIDALVEAKRIDLIENVARDYNPGGRVYAVLELMNLEKKGWKLSSKTQTTLRKVIALPTEISMCFADVINSGLTAKQVLRYYRNYGDLDPGSRPAFIRR